MKGRKGMPGERKGLEYPKKKAGKSVGSAEKKQKTTLKRYIEKEEEKELGG